MKLVAFTIVLDGMPFLPMQLNTLNHLSCDWHWVVVEGAAANVNCTAWCKPQAPRWSNDGTHEFLRSLWTHPRVRSLGSKNWPGGKVQMCNAALDTIKEPCILLQMDADELWEHWQIERLLAQFEAKPNYTSACVQMRYFLGPNIVTLGLDSYGNNPGEWLRAWKFEPGQRFTKHEPPVLSGHQASPRMAREETAAYSIVPDHWAYYFEKQVAYKEQFYGYADAALHWQQLQHHRGPWPIKLRDFLPWVDDRAQADLLHKP